MLARTNSHPLANIPASFPVGERWYVFYTEPQAEKRAQESIAALGLLVFVPFEKRIQRLPRRKPREVELALFPRYGFVRFDINLDAWGAIPGAKGVVDLLRADMIPQSVPDGAIDGLQLADKIGAFDRTKPPSAGMPVEITQGPFAGFIGKIRRARSAERMEVLVKFLNAEIAATVPLSALREP